MATKTTTTIMLLPFLSSRFSKLLCLFIGWLCLFTSSTVGYDVPLKKAMPPKMDPRPTLPEITNRVYMDISIDGRHVGKIVFGLFGKIAPKAVENFVALAKCDRGNGAVTGKPLCYKDTIMHRVIPNFAVHGGDFSHSDGTGGESIYGQVFEDESFEVKHNRPMLLSMSNRGRNTNGSQFFINTVKTQWLDGKHVAFGMVLEGESVVKDIEKRGTFGGKPTVEIRITDCGETKLLPDDFEVHYA